MSPANAVCESCTDVENFFSAFLLKREKLTRITLKWHKFYKQECIESPTPPKGQATLKRWCFIVFLLQYGDDGLLWCHCDVM